MEIVFVHGAGCTEAAWHYQKSYFHRSDAVTLPGHPEGDPLPGIEEYAGWMYANLQDKGFRKVVMAGHSMGGGIALSCALTHPELIAGLVLIGTGARLRVNPAFIKLISDNVSKPPEWFRGIASPMYERVEPAVKEMVLDRQCRIPVATHLNDFLCCDRFDVMQEIGAIMVPTLIICGESDIMTPVKYSKYLSEGIPGSRLVTLAEASHMVFLEKPDEVNREIEAFISSLQPPGRGKPVRRPAAPHRDSG